MNEEVLKSIADSLLRIAVCMENKQSRDVALNKKKIQEANKTSSKK